jgi:DNA invertase Pin-like site-specific DNA recombinase/predicted DNA-binding transcriptional regulator AlpA
MQYALKQKAMDMGWQEANIEIIDRDLGITAASAEGREGFKDLVTKVTLGQVGIVLSYEVTRLARNCSDWYPLLDICGMRGCLIGDRDGIYDPSTANGRLLLGLKGQISELELHTLKGRLTAGIISKAQRGELGLALPVGLVRDKHGLVSKDANIEVQRRIELIFETFLKVRSASKTLRYFNENALTIPRRDHFGDIAWKNPSVAAIISTLKNPAYAGMFVYGRSRAVPSGQSIRNNSQKKLPIEQWRIKVENKYPQYIDRETFDKIQAMLKDNHAEYDRNKTRGVPRPGKALLHGIVYCGECGHKMVVQYKAGTRYLCNYLRQQYGTGVCQHIPADPIDDYVVAVFFEALSPVEIDMYQAAMVARQKEEGNLEKAKQQQLERLRYQARLAERQFNQADPDNRLVAAELERRWESALLELKLAEDKAEQEAKILSVPQIITQKMKKSFDNIGQKMPEVWKQNILSQQQRKALLRCLIDKVVIHRIGRDRVHTRIVWKGGDTTTTDIPITVGSVAELSNAAEMENAIVKMAKTGKSDLEIAETLTKHGFRSPLRKTVLESTVKIIRLNHRILVKRSQSHPRTIAGYLTVPQIASSIGVTKHWVYDRIHSGKISVKKDKDTGLYLFPNKATTINQFMALKNGDLNKLRY